MLKKTIKYVDYEGVEREEDFFFNLSKPEVLEMQVSEDGGLDKYLKRIIKENDAKKIMEIFKVLIKKSYGEKSPDGRRFIKSPELSEAFSQTEAYSNLFMELALNAESASDFVNGIIPKMDELDNLPAQTNTPKLLEK